METQKVNSAVPEILDKSNYLRGLLVLIGKSRNICEQDIKIFLEEGSSLGYEKEFCQTALKESIGNRYLEKEPPRFFNVKFAYNFILKGIDILGAKKIIHPEAVRFLESVAIENDFVDEWKSKKRSLFGSRRFESKLTHPVYFVEASNNYVFRTISM